jgi:hypothetical protein
MRHLYIFFILFFFHLLAFAQKEIEECAAEGKNEENLEIKKDSIKNNLSFPISIPKNTSKTIKKQNLTKNKIDNSNKKLKNNAQKNIQKYKKYSSKEHLGRNKKTKKWNWWRPWLDLDWLMISIIGLLGIGLFIGLWFLFLFRTSLSLLQAILLAISFGIAILFLIHSLSEESGSSGWYEYFIRFGFIAFVGWLMLLAGFVALFGGTPSLMTYFIIGVILGGVSFLLSILVFKDSIFDVPWR